MNDRQRFVRMIAVPLLLAGLTLAVASCEKKEPAPETSATTPAPDNMAAPAISDANIAAIVVAANNADIANGKQAQAKSKDADVKAFAAQMIADHTSVNDKAVALATKLNLTPVDNETSQALKAGQDSVRTAIMNLTGADFNKAYVNNEVTYHETVLDAIDKMLIPNAQNADLKQLLTDVRPAFAAHLDHAKMIQTKLNGMATK